MKPREKKVFKSIPAREEVEGFVWAIVIESFDGNSVGQVIQLCDRRYKSLSNRKKVRLHEG